MRFDSNYLKIVIALLGFVLMGTSHAVQRQRPFFQGSRALAMGDAFTAYGQGYESVFYNPAGVARKGPLQVKYFDFEVKASYPIYSFLSSNLLSFYKLSQLATNISRNPDKVHALGFSLAPQLLTKNFSLGVVMRGYFDGIVNSATSDFDFYSYTDMALYLHYGVSFFGGVVKFGAGAKALNRAELTRTYTEAEYTSGQLSFTTQWQEGIGYGVDAGVLVTAPVSGLPAFGLSVQDLGDTRLLDRRVLFTGARGREGSPPNLRQRVNSGFNITAKHSPGVKSNFAFDIKDVLHLTAANYRERLHLGWELEMDKYLYFRAGYNQGRYWTGGVALKLAGFNLELASWGENLLVYTGETRATRMYVGRYVLSF